MPFPLPLAGETVIHTSEAATVQSQFAVTTIVPFDSEAPAKTELVEIANDSMLSNAPSNFTPTLSGTHVDHASPDSNLPTPTLLPAILISISDTDAVFLFRIKI